MNYQKNVFTIIFFLFIFISPAFADQIRDCDWENKTVIPCVTIFKNINNTSKLTSQTVKKNVITRKQIEISGAIDIIDVLQSIPGINITQSGPKGQQASLFMRGGGSNHVLVMINGIAINDHSTTQGLHDFGVDFIQTIQQVEVYDGPSSVNFGPNAIGGAINIITTGDLKDYFKLKTRNKNNYEFAINKNFISDKSTLYNFKIGKVENRTISARYPGNEIDGVKNLSGNFNFEKWINNIRITNSTYLRETIAEYDESAINENDFVGKNQMLTTQFNLNYSKKNLQNEFSIYHNLYNREYYEQGDVDFYDSNATGVKYEFTNYFDKISYGYGSEYRFDSGNFINNGSYEASTKGNYNNLSIYGNLGYNILENTLVSFFLRNDENKQTGSNQSNKINLEQKIKLFNFGIGRTEGFRNPTIYELYGTDNSGYSGNRNLKAEKSISNEIYLETNFLNNFSFSIKGFKTIVKNQIEYESNKYINSIDDLALKQSGINSQFKIKDNDYILELFSSFLSSDQVGGSPQLRRPEKNYGFNLYKNFNSNIVGNLNLNLKYNYYGKHFDTHSSTYATIEMDSTDLVDLSVIKKLGNYDLQFNVTNLLGEVYQRPHGFSQNGRLFNIALKSNF